MLGSFAYAIVCFSCFVIAEIVLYIGKYENIKMNNLAMFY